MFHTTSSATPSLPRPLLPRPVPRAALPASSSSGAPPQHGRPLQPLAQQQTIAAAAAAAAAARRPGGSAAGLGMSGISAHALLRGSVHARYGREPGRSEHHGHGVSSGVLMGTMPRCVWHMQAGTTAEQIHELVAGVCA